MSKRITLALSILFIVSAAAFAANNTGLALLATAPVHADATTQGSLSSPYNGGTLAAARRHTFADKGTYDVTVRVTDHVPAALPVNELVGLEPPICVTTAVGLVIV